MVHHYKNGIMVLYLQPLMMTRQITEPATAPFEKPVSIEDYPDYAQIIQTPMDLQTVEKKTKAGLYETPEDFEYDMGLVFKNCETYNAARKGEHLVAMAKYGAKQFRRVFGLRMRTFEDPSSVATKEEQKETASAMNPSNKKIKVESAGGVSKGKSAPRISITAAQVSSAAAAAAQAAKAAKPPTASASSNKNRAQPVKANQPVPLHIAIARVKVMLHGISVLLKNRITILESNNFVFHAAGTFVVCRKHIRFAEPTKASNHGKQIALVSLKSS